MKKVLQIKSVGVYGGSGMGEYIGREAIKQGWDSNIAYARNILPTENKFVKISNSLDMYEHALESRLFDNSGFASRGTTRRLISQIKVINPDIIHLHNLHGYFLNVKILFDYLNKSGIPVVWTLHDCWPFTGHCSHFVSVGCEKWKTCCNHCPLTKDYPTSWFRDRSERNFEIKKNLFNENKNIHFVTVSKWLEGITRESFFQNKDIRTIYNGVDIDVFRPLQPSNSHPYFTIIGVAANWGDHKGLSDYVALSKLLKEDERIMLVGVSDKVAQGLPGNIIPIKRTNNIEELVQLYNDADIVTSLSKAETFGMTVVEGYACGRPAIVYNNTAQPELITGTTGYIADDGNIQQVYDCIQKFRVKTLEEKKHIEHSCRKLAESTYNKDTLYKDYLRLYDEVLGNHSKIK